MKLRIGLIIIAVIIAAYSLTLTDFYELGEVAGLYAYFYDGNVILCNSECFLQDGQVMYYKNIFDGQVFFTIGVFFLVGAFSVVLIVFGWISKLFWLPFRRREK